MEHNGVTGTVERVCSIILMFVEAPECPTLKQGPAGPAVGSACASLDGNDTGRKRRRLCETSTSGSGSSSFKKAKVQELEVWSFDEFCQEFGMVREPVPGDGNCMPSSAAQGTVWHDYIRGVIDGPLKISDRAKRTVSIRQDAVAYALQNSRNFSSATVRLRETKVYRTLSGAILCRSGS
jgi:hypothetical protein